MSLFYLCVFFVILYISLLPLIYLEDIHGVLYINVIVLAHIPTHTLIIGMQLYCIRCVYRGYLYLLVAETYNYIKLGVCIRIMFATFLCDITTTFLSVTDTYICIYVRTL